MTEIIIKSFKTIALSFLAAIKGIIYAIFHESHLRFHIVIAGYILYFSGFYNFTRAEFILLIITIMSVISLEMINTSIERTVDLASPDYNNTAGAAKDIAAGAVLVACIFAVIIGFILFFDTDVISEIINYFVATPLNFVILIISIVLSVLFVVFCRIDRATLPEKENEND